MLNEIKVKKLNISLQYEKIWVIDREQNANHPTKSVTRIKPLECDISDQTFSFSDKTIFRHGPILIRAVWYFISLYYYHFWLFGV